MEIEYNSVATVFRVSAWMMGDPGLSKGLDMGPIFDRFRDIGGYRWRVIQNVIYSSKRKSCTFYIINIGTQFPFFYLKR